jgi:hypothetical protein
MQNIFCRVINFRTTNIIVTVFAGSFGIARLRNVATLTFFSNISTQFQTNLGMSSTLFLSFIFLLFFLAPVKLVVNALR